MNRLATKRTEKNESKKTRTTAPALVCSILRTVIDWDRTWCREFKHSPRTCFSLFWTRPDRHYVESTKPGKL